MDIDLRDIFQALTKRRDLTREQSRAVFDLIMAGRMPPSTLGAFLGAMVAKGEAVDELVGAAEAMRARSIQVRCPDGAIDTCGTGGDGVSTFNVSTTAAIIAAGAGATVAKHGNRSTTRASGSTEALDSLGIDVDADVAVVERCLKDVRIGYLNARALHPAMKHAAPVREAIPVRTIFNLLGPLTNPAGTRRQVVGVPRLDLLELMGRALATLGVAHAWVVHGADSLCDLTITGETHVLEVRGGAFRRFTISPEDVGLVRGPLDSLRAGSPEESAETVVRILEGTAGPTRDHALLNAGAALVVAGVAESLDEGVRLAAAAIDGGAAMATLDRWRRLCGGPHSRTGSEGNTE